MPNRVQIRFIKEAAEHVHRLDEWETKFITNLSNYPNDLPLTQPQNESLNKIQRKLKSWGVT